MKHNTRLTSAANESASLLARPSYTDRFRLLIRQLTGISIQPNKLNMIDQRLRRRVLHYKLPDTNSYLKMLLDSPGMEEELRVVIDLITTNTTSFFREPVHFDFLRKSIIPQRIQEVPRGSRARLKIWSAASSEGAEAFTAAIVLEDECRKGLPIDYAILGTDISETMLQKANRAIYSKDQVSDLPQDIQSRYFMAGSGELRDKVRVIPELRRKVAFRSLNLMDSSYPVDKDVDVIFLRNVLIYFDAEDKDKVLNRLVSHLRVGGYMLVGHAESMIVRHKDLHQVEPTIFIKEPQR